MYVSSYDWARLVWLQWDGVLSQISVDDGLGLELQ